ncbi:MAG: hypothetical protein IJ598_07270 [Ruminococcus sp.]|nr:hypothetical protein [Ruminococcus sp.]
MEKISIYKLMYDFNRSDFRRHSIPQELVSGWPALQQIGKTLCVTIPYYKKVRGDGKFFLMPLCCSVTVPVLNPSRIMDFTDYTIQPSWSGVNFSKPAGVFKHQALADVTTKQEYSTLCKEFYDCYDNMIEAILNHRPFDDTRLTTLFSKLMEPGLFPYYQRINKKFYTHFCKL